MLNCDPVALIVPRRCTSVDGRWKPDESLLKQDRPLAYLA
jgi:hypothetical protein